MIKNIFKSRIYFALPMLAGLFILFGLFGPAAHGSEKPEIFVQLGHTDSIETFQFSQDMRYLVTGSDDLTVKLWDVASTMEVRTFRGHRERVKAVAVSADGRQVLSGDEKGEIKLWDATTGLEIRTFTVRGFVTHLSFSPDGRSFTSVDRGDFNTQRSMIPSGMIIWNLSSGQQIRKEDKVNSFPSSDEKFITATGTHLYSRILELSSGKEVGTFGDSYDFLYKSFSQDLRYGLFSGRDYKTNRHKITTVDIVSNRRMATWGLDDVSYAKFAMSPDGRYVASAGERGLKLWDAFSGGELKTFTTSPTRKAVFTPDGKFILSAGGYGPTLWDYSGKIVSSFAQRPLPWLPYLSTSPDGKSILITSDNMPPFVMDASTGEIRKIFKGYKKAASFLADGRSLILVSDSNRLVLWDTVADKAVKTFSGISVGRSRDGKYILEMTTARDLKFREAASDRVVFDYREPSGDISEFAISGNNRQIMIRIGKTIKLIDAATGREALSLNVTDASGIWSSGLSPDGRYITAMVMPEGHKGIVHAIKLWDGQTGKEIKTFLSSHRYSFSPDGRFFLHAVNKEMHLCDIATGRTVKTFRGHKEVINSMSFSDDGKTIVASSQGRTIKLWDVATGMEKMTLAGHDAESPTVVITPDGKRVISTANDGTVRFWDTATGGRIATFTAFTDGEWITMTPEGYFNASPAAAKYLNVTIGNKVYSIDSLFEKFFNPLHVASVLQGRKVEALADIRSGVMTPPDVRIASPKPGETINRDALSVTVVAKDTGGGIDEVRLYHNGKAVGEDARAIKIVSKDKEATKTYSVTLVDGINTFRAVGFSRDRTESNPFEMTVHLSAPQKDVSLHVLAVGINKYRNPALNLNYAVPDAQGITAFFKDKETGLFKKVNIAGIHDEQATRVNITAQLKNLEKTNPQDAVLIYLAGHGENIADKWYFIPHELAYPEREDDVKSKGISSDEIAGLIRNIKAQKVLVMIDSCKSGALLIAMRGFEDRKALSQLSRSTGVHVIAASTKDQYAAEVKDLGHGVFTYTLLEGLKGQAAAGDKTVTVRKLMTHVENRLPDVTMQYRKEAQFPVVDSRGMDFPLVIVK